MIAMIPDLHRDIMVVNMGLNYLFLEGKEYTMEMPIAAKYPIYREHITELLKYIKEHK
jgi:hypothetical protein